MRVITNNDCYYLKVGLLMSPLLTFTNISRAESNAANKQPPHVTLETIYVKADTSPDTKSNEVTGLGKIGKNRETLDEEQVISIRDLTKYDPGISVVEQGQGASTGYSIRGVDKNRVAVVVDDIPQIQSYVDPTRYKANGGSGAMNEIEYENITELEISKGSSSAESGSGALGGSVSFVTKDVDDIITTDKPWGVTSKTVLSSKDNRFAQTVGAAFREPGSTGFEGLLQHTARKGEEIQVHPDALDIEYQVDRIGFYKDKYVLKDKPNQTNTEYFSGNPWAPTFEFYPAVNGCSVDTPNLCTDKKTVSHMSTFNSINDKTKPNNGRSWTAEEIKQLNDRIHARETFTTENYTGSNRIAPNPMQYDTQSTLARFGYNFSDSNYVGMILENTRQHYDIHDMSYRAYYLPDMDKELLKIWRRGNESNNMDGYYTDNPLEGALAPAQWTRSHFVDEAHSKKRYGLTYRHQDSKWADQFELNLDTQKINIDTNDRQMGCNPYPYFDKNCHASSDKVGSWENTKDTQYGETHNRIGTKWKKWFDIGETAHDTQVVTGYDKFESRHSKQESSVQFNKAPASETITKVNGKIIYTPKTTKDLKDYCKLDDKGLNINGRNPRCLPLVIDGHNYYLGLRDNMIINDYLDLGLNVRYDHHSIESDDDFVKDKTYDNWSWSSGIVFKPHSNLDLSYKVASGFRVPSFQESFGMLLLGLDGSNDWEYKSDLEAETSLNQEIGASIHGNWGVIEASYYISDYDGLIGVASEIDNKKLPVTGTRGLHNTFDIKTIGTNINGKLYLDSFSKKIPEGLSAKFGYHKSQPKSSVVKSNLGSALTYPLDTLQPSRYILGLNYDNPNKKWGVGALLIHSEKKNEQDLISKTDSSALKDFSYHVANQTSQPWTTLDLNGYWTINDSFTLRGGIYNALGYRYTTWESIRQSASGSAHQHNKEGNYSRYAAPGRNFVVSLEAKF